LFAILHDACIKKIGVALPSRKVLFDNEHYPGMDEAKKQKLKSIIGFDQRFVAGDETTLDLCQAAVSKIKIKTGEIDALVFVTQTPDYFQPGNAHVLHGRLNLRNDCFCLDVNAGCNGYIQGLWQASLLLQQEEVNSVLVCVGDTISKTVNPRDSSTAPIFGDGGTATLLTKQSGSKSYFSFYTQGNKYDKLIVEGGAYKNLNMGNESFLFMDGTEVMQMAIAEVPSSVESLYAHYGLMKDRTDYFFFHQANDFIISSLVRNLQLSMEKIPLIFSRYGNQSSASIPFAIADTLSNAKAGQCLLSGFGVGFAWANAIVDLSETEVYT
jgi:3-oxoacyl-[acyl-carrier-protein] synthase-3